MSRRLNKREVAGRRFRAASFCKTSGGKVHIVVLLSGKRNWDEVTTFSHAIARHLARVVSQRFTAVSGPDTRIDSYRFSRIEPGPGSNVVGVGHACSFIRRGRESGPDRTLVWA
ncbi:hypothetical protein [Paraburkholderia sp. SIMBA_054]|uniref:non-homologous end-joining DNA ligase LigD n=1 Tax=Paraburkholderia TaxID=1822464 RepID=UPI0039796E7B